MVIFNSYVKLPEGKWCILIASLATSPCPQGHGAARHRRSADLGHRQFRCHCVSTWEENAGRKWMESGDLTNRKHGFNSEKWRLNYGLTIQNRDLTSRNGDFI